MLDTNIISYLIKCYDKTLVGKFKTASEYADITISSISVAELLYGVKKNQSQRLALAVERFLSPLSIVDFDYKSADIYGDIRADLEKQDKVIGALDVLIAAHAKSLDATLITNNTKGFDRVVGLKVENWAA